MNNYPEVVAKIVNDYLERVKSQLRLVPAHEQGEFLREIESHLYEAYQQTPGEDDVARILAVLRNFGEPAEVVSDRLPGAMVRSGTKRNLPLYVVGGIFIALFGLPLGSAGVGVLVGLLAALAGILVAYYAVAGSFLLVGAVTMLLGLTRLILPAVVRQTGRAWLYPTGWAARRIPRSLLAWISRNLDHPVCRLICRRRIGHAVGGEIHASRAAFPVWSYLRLDAAVRARRSAETAPGRS